MTNIKPLEWYSTGYPQEGKETFAANSILGRYIVTYSGNDHWMCYLEMVSYCTRQRVPDCMSLSPEIAKEKCEKHYTNLVESVIL